MHILEQLKDKLSFIVSVPEAIGHFPTYLYNTVIRASNAALLAFMPRVRARRNGNWMLLSSYGIAGTATLLAVLPEDGGIVNIATGICFVVSAGVYVIRILHWDLHDCPIAQVLWAIGQLVVHTAIVIVAWQQEHNVHKFPMFMALACASTRILLWKWPGGIFYIPEDDLQQDSV